MEQNSLYQHFHRITFLSILFMNSSGKRNTLFLLLLVLHFWAKHAAFRSLFWNTSNPWLLCEAVKWNTGVCFWPCLALFNTTCQPHCHICCKELVKCRNRHAQFHSWTNPDEYFLLLHHYGFVFLPPEYFILGSSLISSLFHCGVNPSLLVSLTGCHQCCRFISVIAYNPV